MHSFLEINRQQGRARRLSWCPLCCVVLAVASEEGGETDETQFLLLQPTVSALYNIEGMSLFSTTQLEVGSQNKVQPILGNGEVIILWVWY